MSLGLGSVLDLDLGLGLGLGLGFRFCFGLRFKFRFRLRLRFRVFHWSNRKVFKWFRGCANATEPKSPATIYVKDNQGVSFM